MIDVQLQERARTIRKDAKAKLVETKAERLDRDRDKLKTENEVLQARLDEARDERQHWVEAVEELAKGGTRSSKPKKHRVRRVMVLGAAAGSAYVLGAKAGRERYDQLKEWWESKRPGGASGEDRWGMAGSGNGMDMSRSTTAGSMSSSSPSSAAPGSSGSTGAGTTGSTGSGSTGSTGSTAGSTGSAGSGTTGSSSTGSGGTSGSSGTSPSTSPSEKRGGTSGS